MRHKCSEHNKKVFYCQNFTCVMNGIFNQQACFVLVFEKLGVVVSNVLDEVLQTNHDVDLESHCVEFPNRRQKWPPVSKKGTV